MQATAFTYAVNIALVRLADSSVSRNFHGMDRHDSLHGVSMLCTWALVMQLVVAKARHVGNGLVGSHLASKMSGIGLFLLVDANRDVLRVLGFRKNGIYS